ncbi:MAG: transposase [Comamonas sp.]
MGEFFFASRAGGQAIHVAEMRSSKGCVVSTGTMKEADVLVVLQEVEAGAKVSEVCRKHSISETTFYRWRARYAQVDRVNLPQIRSLQIENERLRRMYVDLALKNTALNDALGAVG